MKKFVLATAVATCVIGLGATSALAACPEQPMTSSKKAVEAPEAAAGQGSATEIVQDMVDDAKAESDDRAAHAPTGPAEPRENWFGCAPGSSAEHCETSNEAAARTTDRERTTAGEDGTCAEQGQG